MRFLNLNFRAQSPEGRSLIDWIEATLSPAAVFRDCYRHYLLDIKTSHCDCENNYQVDYNKSTEPNIN